MSSRRQLLLAYFNRAAGRFDLELVRSEEVRALLDRGGALRPPAEVAPPSGARDVLRHDNPRLLELKRRYAGHPAAARSVWTQDFIAAEVSLLWFRRDNAYVWQSRDAFVWSEDGARGAPAQQVNYLLSAYYIRSLDRLGLLDRLSDDGLFGNVTIAIDENLAVSRDLLDSVLEVDFLDRHLDLANRPRPQILDIGAGYGRLAYRLAEALPNLTRVFCTDAVPESTFICEYYIGFRGAAGRVEVLPLDEVDDRVEPGSIDVATNVHSFSECPLATIEWWLDLLLAKRVPHLFIVPNTGERLLSKEADGSTLDFTPSLTERGYELAAMEPKYRLSTGVQRHGIFPTHYHLYTLARA